jgi:Protein of unknown function (DUF4238)
MKEAAIMALVSHLVRGYPRFVSRPNARAFGESPVVKQLIAIGKGDASLPRSDARNHHYIPQLLLRRFTGNNRLLRRLDKSTGEVDKVGVPSAASEEGFYTFDDADGLPTNDVEAYFGIIENHAARALRRMEDSGELTDVDRATISIFLAMLWIRTPSAREQGEALSQEVFELSAASFYADPGEFRRSYRKREAEGEAEPKSDEEVEEFRLEVMDAVQTGGVKIHDPGGSNVMSILLESALESAERLYLHSSWGLMRAGEGEFVMSDRAQAVFDPDRPFPWVMDAPFSSLKSQTTTPISSESCLIVVPAPDRAHFQVKTITGKEVDEVNLRSFGWAGHSIFGSSTALVSRVSEMARKKPDCVKEPRPFRNLILIERDFDDERLADAHRERGWPPFMTDWSQGFPRRMDYMVVGADGDSAEVGATTSELAKYRALKAAGLPPDSDVEGASKTQYVHPLDLSP